MLKTGGLPFEVRFGLVATHAGISNFRLCSSELEYAMVFRFMSLACFDLT